MKILIMDDEIITVKGIMKGINWEQLPYEEVFSTTTVEEAKQILKSEAIDLMLCDIEMPQQGGLDLLEWTKEQGMDIACIFLTCHSEFSYAQKALKLQSLDYILKPIPYPELQEILSRTAAEIEKKQENTMFQQYGRTQVKKLQDDVSKNAGTSGAEIVEKVKAYIQTHLEEDISVELLASHANISVSQLFRIFKSEEKTTPVDYITRLRLFYASQMLKESDLPVSRIATSVGYNNYSYFTKIFKNKYGMTPSQYQREFHSHTN